MPLKVSYQLQMYQVICYSPLHEFIFIIALFLLHYSLIFPIFNNCLYDYIFLFTFNPFLVSHEISYNCFGGSPLLELSVAHSNQVAAFYLNFTYSTNSNSMQPLIKIDYITLPCNIWNKISLSFA